MAYEYKEYEHHDVLVKVRADLKGQHREHCLCWQCKHFQPGETSNCGVAEEVFAVCKRFGLVLPVWECPFFGEFKG